MISYIPALGFAAGLALDTAAVAAARAVAGRPSSTLPWVFGAAHGLMATLGWAVGRGTVAVLDPWHHWIAFAVLVFLGMRMIVSSCRGGAPGISAQGRWELAALTIATSLDALAAGFAIDELGVPAWITIALVVGVCVAFTLIANALGRSLARSSGRWLERAGGAILIAVAIQMVV